MARVAVPSLDNVSNSLLTWQGQRHSHNGMESTPQTSNVASGDRSHPDSAAGTLSTRDESEWADLDYSSYPQRSYTETQLRADPRYSGITDCWSDDEALAIFHELVVRFPLHSFGEFALPPTGLPGTRWRGMDHENPQAKLLSIGLQYAQALIRNEGRGMHRRWEDASDFIRQLERSAELRAITEEIRRSAADFDAREASQLVYFIAAASGPIKVGMAINPQNRLKGLQTSHHEKLELLATCEGGQPQERAYHRLFAARRLNGEWFERCPEIEAEIARLTAVTQHQSGDRQS